MAAPAAAGEMHAGSRAKGERQRRWGSGAPMRPQKRLKVLGMRVLGLTRNSTPLAVVTYTACGGGGSARVRSEAARRGAWGGV